VTEFVAVQGPPIAPDAGLLRCPVQHRPGPPVGFEVRVWTVHDKGVRAAPGCEKCRRLLTELEELVRWTLPAEERPTLIQVKPTGPILCALREVPGTDEVALTIRLTQREEHSRPIDACVERCLKHLRDRSWQLGIPDR
jgi:hypothetical protein